VVQTSEVCESRFCEQSYWHREAILLKQSPVKTSEVEVSEIPYLSARYSAGV